MKQRHLTTSRGTAPPSDSSRWCSREEILPGWINLTTIWTQSTCFCVPAAVNLMGSLKPERLSSDVWFLPGSLCPPQTVSAPWDFGPTWLTRYPQIVFPRGWKEARLVTVWPRMGLFPAVDEKFGCSLPSLSAWTGLQAVACLVASLVPAGFCGILCLRWLYTMCIASKYFAE